MAIPVEHKPVQRKSSDEGAGLAQSAAPRPAAHIVSGIQAIALAALLLAGFWPILAGIYGSWFDERSYMEHGILVVPAAAYMAWAKRDKLAAVVPQPALFPGIALLAWGALQAVLGTLGEWVW